MENKPENTSPLSAGVGASLKKARENAGLGLGEVADRLKLSVRQLEAIEKDDFQQLPGAAFVRGFVRNYARFLNIDDTPLLAALEEHFPSAVNDVVNLVKQGGDARPLRSVDEMLQGQAPGGKSGLPKALLALLALAVVLGGIAWFAMSGLGGKTPEATIKPVDAVAASDAPAIAASDAVPAVASEPTPGTVSLPVEPASVPTPTPSTAVQSQVAASQPLVKAPAASASAPATESVGEGRISLSAREAAWISVIDANGKKLQFGTLEAGASKELSGTPPFQLKIGNAAQVQLNYNGQPVALTDKIRGTTAKIELK